jgi:hypothetical protein
MHKPHRNYKQQATKKKNLLVSLLVPMALAFMCIPLYLYIIMKLIEWLQ